MTRGTRTHKLSLNALLVCCCICVAGCSSSSGPDAGWQKKNKELIGKYNLSERKLPELPRASIASNLEPAEVTSIDKLDSIALYPGVNAKLFLGKWYDRGHSSFDTQCRNSGRNLTCGQICICPGRFY